MSRTLTGKDADVTTKRVQYTHGRLMPVVATYYKWADKDAEGKKIDGSGGEVEYEQWVKLPENKRGQKWEFDVDPRVLKPELEYTAKRGVMLGFKEWQEIVAPSIMDTVGMGDKSIIEFVERASTGNWFAESELVFTGYYKNAEGQEKPQNTHRFIRMTQDLNELKAWNAERYPKKEEELPEDVVTQAKLVFEKMAKRNMDKFLTILNGNEELNPHMVQLKELATTW